MPDPYTAALRNSIKEVRSQVSSTYINTSSNQVCKRISLLEPYKQAQKIGLYRAVNCEIDLTSLWHFANVHNKVCYFPVLNPEQTLSFLPATPETSFKNNRFNIPEPDVSLDLAISVEDLDLIILPLVAFDLRCTRLGMGAGYYDRTLQKKEYKQLFGVAYQFQKINFISPQPWDIPLDAVITQKAIYLREAPL